MSVEMILGDFRMVDLPARVDHVITDPPYERHMHAAKRGEKLFRNDGYAAPQGLDFDAISDDARRAVCELAAARCAGWFMAFCTPEGVAAWRDAIEAAGMKYKRAMPWVKPDSAPQFNGQGPAGACEMMVAAWAGRGHSRWNGGGGRGEFRGPCQPSGRDGRHPTEKPIWLMMNLVRLFTRPGDLILDPFAGGGSTGVAALRLGRRFVGVEVDPKYHAMALDRLHLAETAPPEDLGPLFAGAA